MKAGAAKELKELKSLCENILHLLTTTVSIMEEVRLFFTVLKALIQPSCLARVFSWLTFVVVFFMGHENGENKGRPRDDTCKA